MTVLFVGLIIACVFLLYKNVGAATVAPKHITGPLATPPKLVVPYADLVYMSSRTWGVDAALIAAVMRQESNFNSAAISSKKCYGLMQISLMICQDFGYVKDWRFPTSSEISKIMDPQMNINIGTRQLSLLLGSYGFDVAIQMYNVGIAGYNEKGYRAVEYLTRVKRFYDEYKV